MTGTTISKRSKCLFLALLALLNIIIRVPSIPHERGSPDEFTMHILANSLSTFGHANWWIHPSAVFGFYPYSYASSTPFVYSGTSQCTGIDLGWVAWIFCAIMGVFVMFSAYMMAGVIKDDDLFKFLVAFTVSLSQGVLTYLTWQISARGFFIALLPFFIYLLLKSRAFAIRCGALTFIIFILLMATHHYYILVAPIIFSFIIVIIFYKSKGSIAKFIRIPDAVCSIAILASILGMFSIPFFTGLFIRSSRYGELHLMLENTIRYSGPFFLLGIVGLIYLAFKRDREFGEWFLLLTVIFWAPFMWIYLYAQYFTVILLSVLLCIALANITKAYKPGRAQIRAIIIIVLLLSVSFSGFYQHWRTGSGAVRVVKWYVEDSTYNCARWVGDSINMDKRLIGSSKCDFTPTRVFAISRVPTLVMPETDITYGFINSSTITVVMNSPLSTKFYMDNPYLLITTYPKTVADKWYLGCIDIDSGAAKRIIHRYNISYYIEDTCFPDIFTRSLQKGRGKSVPIYNNGRICIWYLN